MSLDNIKIYNEIYLQHFAHTKTMLSTRELIFFMEYCKQEFGTEAIILDAGCGGGRDTIIFTQNNFKTIAVDLNINFIELCRSKLQLAMENKLVNIIHANFLDLKYINFLSGIWCSFALTHTNLEYLKKAIFKFQIMLKNNGILFLGLRDKSNINIEWSEIYKVHRNYYNFSFNEILSIAEDKDINFELIYYDFRNEQDDFGKNYRDINRHYFIFRKR